LILNVTTSPILLKRLTNCVSLGVAAKYVTVDLW